MTLLVDPRTLRTRALSDQRDALAEELARVRRWQRLVQARLDLATDLLSPADALVATGGGDASDQPAGLDVALHPDGAHAHQGVSGSSGCGIAALVRGTHPAASYDVVDDLRAVVAARRALASRSAEVSRRLAAAEADLASHAEPAHAEPTSSCCSRA